MIFRSAHHILGLVMWWELFRKVLGSWKESKLILNNITIITLISTFIQLVCP